MRAYERTGTHSGAHRGSTGSRPPGLPSQEVEKHENFGDFLATLCLGLENLRIVHDVRLGRTCVVIDLLILLCPFLLILLFLEICGGQGQTCYVRFDGSREADTSPNFS